MMDLRFLDIELVIALLSHNCGRLIQFPRDLIIQGDSAQMDS